MQVISIESVRLPTSGNLTKPKLSEMAANLVQGVQDGEIDPLDMDIRLKALEEIISEARGLIKSQAIKEAEKGVKELYGCKIGIKAGSITPIYDNDSFIKEMNTCIKDRKEIIKNAFKLQEKGLEVVDPATGELMPKIEVKGSSESISYEFKK